MGLEELKIIASFSLKKWNNKKEDAIGNFLTSIVVQRKDPIFNGYEREEAEVALQECCSAIRQAFCSFAASFEVDHRSEAQYWRSGLQLLVDDFLSNSLIHSKLEVDLLASEEVKELEERIVDSEDCEAWGSGSERPPTNMPLHHTWLPLSSRRSEEAVTEVEKCSTTIPDLQSQNEQCTESNCRNDHLTGLCTCREGERLFLHDQCKDDGRCVNEACPYKHYQRNPINLHESFLTKLIMNNEGASKPPVIPSNRPRGNGKKGFGQISMKTSELQDQSVAGSCQTNIGQRQKRRCMFFPKCTNKSCEFIHPNRQCRNLARNVKCPGQWCHFKHGQCPDDGACINLDCVHEHYESAPALFRKHVATKRGSLHSSGCGSSIGSSSSVFSDGSDNSASMPHSSGRWMRLSSNEE